jgi:nicotinamidase-related amidase
MAVDAIRPTQLGVSDRSTGETAMQYVLETSGKSSYAFDPLRTALLVIDMQNEFCHPQGWYFSLGEAPQLTRRPIPPLSQVLSFARAHNMLVVFTREGHLPDLSDLPASKRARYVDDDKTIGDAGPLGRILIRGEYGHAIIDELAPLPGEIVIDKPGQGAFYGTTLDLVLREHRITHLLFTGVTTECCVHSTMREANDRGYWCLLLEDCCAALTQRDHDDAVEMVRRGGALGWTTTSSVLLAAPSTIARGQESTRS